MYADIGVLVNTVVHISLAIPPHVCYRQGVHRTEQAPKSGYLLNTIAPAIGSPG